jgi:hypothetical protein
MYKVTAYDSNKGFRATISAHPMIKRDADNFKHELELDAEICSTFYPLSDIRIEPAS